MTLMRFDCTDVPHGNRYLVLIHEGEKGNLRLCLQMSPFVLEGVRGRFAISETASRNIFGSSFMGGDNEGEGGRGKLRHQLEAN